MKSTILVIGGAGYIGSHVCKALSARGLIPVTYDNFLSGNEDAVQWGPLENGDIRDQKHLISVLKRYKPRAIMHFAGLMQVADSQINPADFYDVNVTGTMRVLDAGRMCGIKDIILSSSAAVYGLQDSTAPLCEGASLAPVNAYGRSKMMMEDIAQDYARAYDMRYAALRYFNAAGADPDGDIGTAYPKDTHLIPLLMLVASGHQEHITVFGQDYDTPDSTAIRDYIHVSDIAEAHVKALDHIRVSKQSVTLNLGSGAGHSVLDVINAARRMTGVPISATNKPRRAGDPPRLIADPSKAMRVLDWRPLHSDLDTIIETAWAWRKKQLAQPETHSQKVA